MHANRTKAYQTRLAFWANWLGPNCPYPEDRAIRMKVGRPLPDWAVQALPRRNGKVRILDVNAGPASALGTRAKGYDIELVPTDSLGHKFGQLLEQTGLHPPVPTTQCSPEDILVSYGKATFDLIYSSNGLDFTSDPVAIYRELLQCLTPGGRIITFHEAPANEKLFHHEWHRFFHRVRHGRPVIQKKTYRRDLQDALPEATIQVSIESGYIRLELANNPDQHKITRRMPAPISQTDHPPRLISMHLPKVAGSSFRAFLEEVYKDDLRCMYKAEETAPRLVPKLKLAEHIRCVHGHFQADSYDKHLPGAVKITWMRHPVERVVSSYFQYLRNPESADEDEFNKTLINDGWSLLEFARNKSIINQIRWYFNAVPLDDFLFIGISEEFDASMRLFCHLMGIDAPDKIDQANVNPNRTLSGYTLTDAQRNELSGLYAEEIELYNLVRRRLSVHLRQAFGDQAPELSIR